MAERTGRKRPSIAVLEIYSHHVFVHTLTSILLKCGFDVTIYTLPRIFDDLVPLFKDIERNVKWVTCGKNENEWQFMRRITPEIDKKHDLLFINSVQGFRIGLFFLFKNQIKTIAGAGRISEFFGIKYKFFGHASLRKFLHHNYTRMLLQKCIPRYEAIFVHTDQAHNFALEHGYKKPIIKLPFSLYKGGVSVDKSEKKVWEFVVTGSIIKSSRDHMGVLDAFEKLWKSGRSDINLTILSSPRNPYAYQVYDRMVKLDEAGFPIRYFDGWLKESVFLEAANRADFFLSPLHVSYYSCGELTSGIVETIRQGKPGIYPSEYILDPEIRDSSMFYDHIEDLPDLIEDLLNDREKVTLLSENAIKNSEKYTVDTVAPKLKEIITQILE